MGKSWDYHVTDTLQTTLAEGEAMVGDSVEFLVGNGLRVLFDAEHFFDGYKRNPEFSLRVLEAAVLNGASHLVLCDTNGGSLPFEVEQIVGEVKSHFREDATIAIHTHDDTGCAVANAMAAVRAGARQVQGTMNGLGERTGNCNLTTVIPNLTLKMGLATLPEGRMERLTGVSHHIAELVNRPLNPQAPYVGSSAFAHKAGLHVSAIAKRKDAYEHVDPELVGNGTRFIVSEMAGKATIKLKAQEIGLDMDGAAVSQVIDDLKRLEHEGYHFEAADASLELLMRRAGGWEQEFFRVESMRVITDELPNGEFTTEATVKVWVPGGEGSAGARRYVHTAEGNGPVNAIDTALRAAVGVRYPGARAGPPDRLQGPHPRRRHGDRSHHPGVARRQRRGAILDHHRRVVEHHRGVLAGAGRLHGLRPASRRPALDGPRRARQRLEQSPMTAPRFVPVSPVDKPRSYESPDHVPEGWRADRPAELTGRQPGGRAARLPGPGPGLRPALGRALQESVAAATG